MRLKNVSFTYTRKGHRFTANTRSSIENRYVALNVKKDGDVFTVDIIPREEIVIERVYADFEREYNSDDRIFLNGYQSWTDSAERHTGYSMRRGDHPHDPILKRYAFTQYGDYAFADYSPDEQHGFTYGYIDNGSGDIIFMGSLNEDNGFTVITCSPEKDLIRMEKDCRGLSTGDRYGALSVFIAKGHEKDMFDRWFELMNIKPRTDRKISGYTSWYRHYQDISADKLIQDMESLDAQRFPCDVFQIDDGYQRAVGDWLLLDEEKFPEGLEPVVTAAKERGLTPGLWLAPFVAEERSLLFMEHPDWFVKDSGGSMIKAAGNWSGAYALDIYNEEVRAYLTDVFDTVINKWGIEFLKLDFLYGACIVPREDRTRGAVMHDAMAFLRQLAGDVPILACGVPLASAFGVADYCRIGCDVSLDWDDKFYMRRMHRERPSTKNSIVNSVFRRQLSGRAFINDPDVFILRDEGNTMTRDQRKALAQINALCGGVLFTSDDMSTYGEWQYDMLREIAELKEKGSILSAALDRNVMYFEILTDDSRELFATRV